MAIAGIQIGFRLFAFKNQKRIIGFLKHKIPFRGLCNLRTLCARQGSRIPSRVLFNFSSQGSKNNEKPFNPWTKAKQLAFSLTQNKKAQKGPFYFVRAPGVEPGTFRVSVECSTS